MPGAAQKQGAAGVLSGEVKANEQLFNNMGITKGNYASSANYQRFKLVMASLGMKKEADLSYAKYLNYMHDTWSGKQQRELTKTINSRFSQDLGQKAGESPKDAIADASANDGGQLWTGKVSIPSSAIAQEMLKVQEQNKWKNIGVTMNGKFKSLGDIGTMSARERDALYAKIATGDMTLSHVNQHGRLIKGTYGTGTLLDKEGKAQEQFSMYGQTPNRAAMHKAENRAVTVELGPNAQKIFSLLDNPSALNRYLNKFNYANGKPISKAGNSLRAGNNPSKSK